MARKMAIRIKSLTLFFESEQAIKLAYSGDLPKGRIINTVQQGGVVTIGFEDGTDIDIDYDRPLPYEPIARYSAEVA
jgi:hypothetical protein